MRKLLLKQNKGFSLLESVLYLALFGIIFLTIIQFAFAVGDNNQKAKYKNSIDRDMIFVNQHLTETFKNAENITLAESIFNNDSGQLTLTDNGDMIIYSLTGGRVRVQRNTDVNFITDADQSVSQLNFIRINDADGNIQGVHLSWSATSVKEPSTSRSFNTFYLLK